MSKSTKLSQSTNSMINNGSDIETIIKSIKKQISNHENYITSAVAALNNGGQYSYCTSMIDQLNNDLKILQGNKSYKALSSSNKSMIKKGVKIETLIEMIQKQIVNYENYITSAVIALNDGGRYSYCTSMIDQLNNDLRLLQERSSRA